MAAPKERERERESDPNVPLPLRAPRNGSEKIDPIFTVKAEATDVIDASFPPSLDAF